MFSVNDEVKICAEVCGGERSEDGVKTRGWTCEAGVAIEIETFLDLWMLLSDIPRPEKNGTRSRGAKEGSFVADDFSPSESPEADNVVKGHGGPKPRQFQLLAPVQNNWSILSKEFTKIESTFVSLDQPIFENKCGFTGSHSRVEFGGGGHSPLITEH